VGVVEANRECHAAYNVAYGTVIGSQVADGAQELALTNEVRVHLVTELRLLEGSAEESGAQRLPVEVVGERPEHIRRADVHATVLNIVHDLHSVGAACALGGSVAVNFKRSVMRVEIAGCLFPLKQAVRAGVDSSDGGVGAAAGAGELVCERSLLEREGCDAEFVFPAAGAMGREGGGKVGVAKGTSTGEDEVRANKIAGIERAESLTLGLTAVSGHGAELEVARGRQVGNPTSRSSGAENQCLLNAVAPEQREGVLQQRRPQQLQLCARLAAHCVME
jgi:hypothetical protein